MAPPTDWLLLRGLSRDQRHWGRFPDVLVERLPGVRAHCLDLPGTGTEWRRYGPSTIRAIMEDTRRRWQALREAHPGPWGLLAISLGGMVAMQWCGDHPDDFAALVIVNTSAGNLSSPWRRMDLRVVPDVVRALFERDRVSRERRLLRITTRMQNDLQPIAERWAGFQEDRPVSRATALRQILAGLRFRAPDALAPPTLVVSGAKDPLTDPDCPRRLARHFGAPLAIHPEAGHDLPLDDPDWLAACVGDWVAPRAASVG